MSKTHEHETVTGTSGLKRGDTLRVTLVREIREDAYGERYIAVAGSRIPVVALGARARNGAKTLDTAETATQIEKVTEVPPPYTAAKGDVVKAHFSNGVFLYVFDGERFVHLSTVSGSSATDSPQSRSRIEGMVRSGVAPKTGLGYAFGAEHLFRNGEAVEKK